jgi:alkylhydroperoxidase family enzyme
MPRLKQIGRDEARADVRAMYDRVFGADRDPVKQPGTATGTPGNWWTVHANVPDILRAFQAFDMGANKALPAREREIAIVRTGFLRESQFVFSQHCKAARAMGVSQEQLDAIPHWQVADVFDATQRLVLAYTDALVLQNGRVSGVIVQKLKDAIGDEGVLILGYAVLTYCLHATSCRALRLEYDDIDERVVEVPAPAPRSS